MEKKKKWQIFYQNHGLTSLEKCKFCDFLKRYFYGLERLVFNRKSDKTPLLALFDKNEKKKKFQIFDQTKAMA